MNLTDNSSSHSSEKKIGKIKSLNHFKITLETRATMRNLKRSIDSLKIGSFKIIGSKMYQPSQKIIQPGQETKENFEKVLAKLSKYVDSSSGNWNKMVFLREFVV